jgi:hypothetical protein
MATLAGALALRNIIAGALIVPEQILGDEFIEGMVRLAAQCDAVCDGWGTQVQEPEPADRTKKSGCKAGFALAPDQRVNRQFAKPPARNGGRAAEGVSARPPRVK